MSKFKCQCGYIVVDRTDYQHDKGWIVKDQLADELYSLENKITGYVESVATNSQAQWLSENFPLSYLEHDLTHEQVISIILNKYLHEPSLIIQQCDECDRIHIIEINRLHSFNPESDGSHHLLANYGSKRD